MAVSVIDPAKGLFDPKTRDKASIKSVLNLALFGKARFPTGTSLATQAGATVAADLVQIDKELRTAQVMVAHMLGRRAADFRGTFDTSDNAALASAFSLTAKGVTFPAATMRRIVLRMVSSNNADTIHQQVEQDVWGNDGVTPVLGEARLIKAHIVDAGVFKRLGIVNVDAVVAVESAQASPGTALAGYSSGAAALTFPPSRAVHVIGCGVSQDAYEIATSPALASISAISASGGTAVFNATLSGTGVATDPPAADISYGTLELWPEAQIQLALNVTAVEVHIRTTLSDIFRHRVEVFVGPAESNALSA